MRAVPSANAQSPDAQSVAGGKSGIEPSLLISIPIVCYAIRAGWMEKESLIFGKKDAYNNVGWRKPIEILKDHDEQGIRNILNTIGEKRILEFMKKEGFGLKAGLSAEDSSSAGDTRLRGSRLSSRLRPVCFEHLR